MSNNKFSSAAPRRNWLQGENGKWSSVPWTKAARARAERGGAWFGLDHDFDRASGTSGETSEAVDESIFD